MPLGQPHRLDRPTRRAEIRQGWRLLALAFIGITIGISSTYFFSLGLFMKSIAADLALGRGTVAAAPLIVTLVTAALSPLVGRMVDRFGAMPVAFAGAAAFATALLLLAAFTSGRWSFLCLILLLAVAGAGTIPLPFTRLIVGNFTVARGMALGIALAGTGMGAALVAAFIGPIVAHDGWRDGYRLLGFGVFAGLGVCLLLWFLPGNRARQAAPGTRPPVTADPMPARDHRTPRQRGLIPFVAIFFLAAFGNLTLVIHFVPMLTDAGVSLTRASAIASGIGLSLIVGRLVTGWLLDTVRAETLGAVLFLVVATGMILLIVGGTQLAVVAAIVAGFGIGAEVDIMAFLIARYFALSRFGAVYGTVYAVFLIGSASGPAAAGYLFDMTGNYRAALIVASAALTGAALLLVLLPRLLKATDAGERAADFGAVSR